MTDPTPQPDPAVVLTTDEVVALVVVTQGDGTALAEVVRRMIAARTADADARLADALDMLREATEWETEPCRLDHNGDCQEHGYCCGPCLIPRARAALSVTAPDAGQHRPNICPTCGTHHVSERVGGHNAAGQREASPVPGMCPTCDAEVRCSQCGQEFTAGAGA